MERANRAMDAEGGSDVKPFTTETEKHREPEAKFKAATDSHGSTQIKDSWFSNLSPWVIRVNPRKSVAAVEFSVTLCLCGEKGFWRFP
jgi:hypothetical protein